MQNRQLEDKILDMENSYSRTNDSSGFADLQLTGDGEIDLSNFSSELMSMAE